MKTMFDSHSFGFQFVHPQPILPQFRLNRLPGRRFALPPQQKHQPVTGEVQFPHFLPADPLDRFAGLSYPGLYGLFAVVALR